MTSLPTLTEGTTTITSSGCGGQDTVFTIPCTPAEDWNTAREVTAEHLQQMKMRDDLGDDDFDVDDEGDYVYAGGVVDRAPARRTRMSGGAPVGYQPKIPSFSGEPGDGGELCQQGGG